jgi:stage V sporulation protein G
MGRCGLHGTFVLCFVQDRQPGQINFQRALTAQTPINLKGSKTKMSDNKNTIAPESANTSKPLALDVRVNAINPRDNLIGFANVTINDSIVIEGLKVCTGEKGIYVNMPSVQDKDGKWRDIVKPITAQCRTQITEAVTEAYGIAIERMQATVEAARVAAMPTADKDNAKAPGITEDVAAKNGASKPSALEALHNGKQQAKEQPVKSPAAKGDKTL